MLTRPARNADGCDALRGLNATLRAAVVGAALLLGAWALRDVLLLAFAAVLVACALRLAADRLSALTGIGSGWCLVSVVLALLLLLVLFGWWRGGTIAAQAVELGDQFKVQAEGLWLKVGQTGWGARLAAQAREAVRSSLASIGGYVTGFASSALGAGGSLLLVGVAALFIAASPRTYVDGALQLLPPRVRARGREVLGGAGRALQLWFLGQLLDMVVVAVLIGAGLYLLGVPLALTLALFAGLLNFVPFIGALAGAVPAVLVALGQSFDQALWVAGLFVVVQTLEGNVIAPLIQRRTVSLPPALTLFSQTVLGTLLGPLGLILATPVMAAVVVVVRMAYVEGVLERPDGDGG